MSIGEKAKAIHAEGFNCAQSVVAALSEKLGVDELNSKRYAAGFGGGLRSGEACGAVTGAVMALGLGVAKDGIGSKDVPVAAYSKQLVSEFKAKFGAVRCNDLLMSTGGSHDKCDEYISWCAERAAELIDEYAAGDKAE